MITICIISECENAHTDQAGCEYWALLGECEDNPDWMLLNCYKACKNCASNETRGMIPIGKSIVKLHNTVPYIVCT